MATLAVEIGKRASAPADVFDDGHYASTTWRKLVRSLQLGPKYYFWDLPRYFRNRAALGMAWADFEAFLNPLREFRRKAYEIPSLPPGYADALRQIHEAGVRLTIPRHRLEALVGVWWAVREVAGDVIECGAFRGATSLLLAVLGRMNDVAQTVWVLDTFTGMPTPSSFDSARASGEFSPGEDQVDRILDQAGALRVLDRVQVVPGLFADSFATLQNEDLRFAFVHIDANIFQSTWEACEFAIPRTNQGGAVVFDDYNGVCDLGARLAIDKYFLGAHPRLTPLAGSSACLRI